MTITQLKYVMSLWHFQYFGKATENCSISQPTLSIAFKNLESELGIDLFERSKTILWVTALGAKTLQQAQHYADETSAIAGLALSGRNNLNRRLHLYAVFTISPNPSPHFISSLQNIIDALRTPNHQCNLQGITKI
jgi:LysR family hydrogen peroxide-inducible transcriptional activator